MNTKAQSVKNSLKELAPALIISFVFNYMLFLYEPINTYSSNKMSFWFDFKILIPLILIMFGIFFVISAAIFTGVYLICRKVGKPMMFKILVAAVIFLFLPLYIQESFFNFGLPVLDGTPIAWSTYMNIDLYWLIFTVCCGLIFVCCIKKFGIDKILKYTSLLSLAFFVMLTSSLVVTVLQNDSLKEKNNIIATNNNFSTMSSEKNFVVFVVDTVSAGKFDEILSENPQYSDVFKDFTLYTNTMSVYPYTSYAIPLILTGQVSRNESIYEDFSTNAYNNSPLFSALEKNNYDINLYESEIYWSGDKKFNIKNGNSIYNCPINYSNFLYNELKYIWFKFAPYTLKKYSNIETLDLTFGVDPKGNAFNQSNDSFYEMVRENPNIEKQQRNVFQFIHTEGAHLPFVYDENVNRIKGGTSYTDSVKATITTLKTYIDRLKANGIYDNTAIVIVGDHGHTDNHDFNPIEITRLNPVLLIKGINENHELFRNDLPLIQSDLIDAYSQLLDGKQSTDLFADITNPRTRTVLVHNLDFVFQEYTTDGKVTEYDKFIPTGNVYEYPK